MIDWTSITISIAAVAISAIAAYCYLQWLAVFKRRNDLADKFQAFERSNDERITSIETMAASERALLSRQIERIDGLQHSQEERAQKHAQRFSDLENDLATLKATIAAAVEKVQTTQVATFMQPLRPPGSRPKMYP